MVKMRENQEKLNQVLRIVRKREMIDAGLSLADVIIMLDEKINEMESKCDMYEIKVLRLQHTIQEMTKQINYMSRDENRMTAEDWYAEN